MEQAGTRRVHNKYTRIVLRSIDIEIISHGLRISCDCGLTCFLALLTALSVNDLTRTAVDKI